MPTPSRSLLAVITVAVLVGACGGEQSVGSAGAPSRPASSSPAPTAGGSGTPVPTVTLTPTTAPTPTPEVDVAAAFLDALGEPASLTATVEGTLTTRSGTTPITGEYQQSGRDYHLKLIVDPARAKRPVEYTLVLGQRTTPSRGVTLRSQVPAGVATLATLIDDLAGLTVQGDGTGPFAGARHLVPATAPTAPLDFLAGISPEAAQATPTLDLYAAPDGTPVGAMTKASWTGKTTGTASVELRFTIAPGTGDASITAPTTVYQLYQSKRYKMSVAHPVGWEIRPAKRGDRFDLIVGDADQYLQVYRNKTQGASLNEWTSIYIRGFKRDFKNVKVISNKVTKIAGMRARRVALSLTIDGDKARSQMIVVVRNGWYYVLTMDIYAADDATVTANFEPILKSFRFP